jgi:hypothetical protein
MFEGDEATNLSAICSSSKSETIILRDKNRKRVRLKVSKKEESYQRGEG